MDSIITHELERGSGWPALIYLVAVPDGNLLKESSHMARAAVRAFIPCRRVAAPGVVGSSEIAGFHPPVGNAHLADRNDRNPHLRPTPAGVQAQPRRSRSRRLGERNPSGRRARAGGWERPERRRCWAGKALPWQLRFVVKHPLPISPSRDWFALDWLCEVGAETVSGKTGPSRH